ncbi:TetR family transcriptional regulator [Actinoplanes capillaceus]|uniref:TetR family transcriptional regulator n=1 Tax=Actinoplanes campanulatus TaxID=113559 RepID=A0ABQ3WQ34_9ACTN|nr:TetR/AcrR family transcriptional regulator [Actinoplanes capillaceus]GID48317.1 TetR family transcriptional regulator [Actinoplanes capillaceus]
MEFKRARSDEQRDERRRQILRTAAEMLAEMPVAKISLNELSRRVGLAKSNVLRYFESREAVLLELLDVEVRDWLAYLDHTLKASAGTPRERGDQLAADLAGSLAQRPALCDLTSAHAGVLEHNVSADVALRHKRATRDTYETQARLILRCLPELGSHDATQLAATATLITAAAWPYSRPPEALLAAYATDPALAAMRVDFTDLLRQTLAVTISGLLARQQNPPVGVPGLKG